MECLGRKESYSIIEPNFSSVLALQLEKKYSPLLNSESLSRPLSGLWWLSDKAIKGVTGLSKNVMAHIEEGKQMCDPIFKKWQMSSNKWR
jgi:hypothetical protein